MVVVHILYMYVYVLIFTTNNAMRINAVKAEEKPAKCGLNASTKDQTQLLEHAVEHNVTAYLVIYAQVISQILRFSSHNASDNAEKQRTNPSNYCKNAVQRAFRCVLYLHWE